MRCPESSCTAKNRRALLSLPNPASAQVTAMGGHHNRWRVKTDQGMTCQFLIMSNGPLNRPKLPASGISISKNTFHTSRWDYDTPGKGRINRSGRQTRRRRTGNCFNAFPCCRGESLYARGPSSVRDNRAPTPLGPSLLRLAARSHGNFNAYLVGSLRRTVMDG